MPEQLTHLSLFSGIPVGGLDLGLDRAGWTCVGQVELNPFCQRVLAKHWPEVPRHDDVRTAPAWWLGTARPAVYLVAGGFPCQPFSTAGRRRGTADERWGWPWFWDVVRVARPRYVLVENVAALFRDADAWGYILADLATGGYDADWDCVPAAAVGAPHRRDRVFLVAHAIGELVREQPIPVGRGGRASQPGDDGPPRYVADPDDQRLQGRGLSETERRRTGPDAHRRSAAVFRWPARPRGEWATEPDVGRVAHGIPARVDRLRGLGNAVVPQAAEHIGRLIRNHAEAAS